MADFLTIKEAAAVARVDERTVRQWISKGAVRVFASPASARRLFVIRADVAPRETTRTGERRQMTTIRK